VRERVEFGPDNGTSIIGDLTRAAARGPLATEVLSGAPIVLRYADVESTSTRRSASRSTIQMCG